MTRGIIHDVERFITQLRGQYFQTKVGGEQKWMQVGVRPIQLWEIAHPAGGTLQLMNSLWEDPNFGDSKRFKLPLNVLRKILRAKKMPALDITAGKRLIHHPNVGIYAVGYREDNFLSDGTELV